MKYFILFPTEQISFPYLETFESSNVLLGLLNKHSIVMKSRSFYFKLNCGYFATTMIWNKAERVKVPFNMISLLIRLHEFSPFQPPFILFSKVHFFYLREDFTFLFSFFFGDHWIYRSPLFLFESGLHFFFPKMIVFVSALVCFYFHYLCFDNPIMRSQDWLFRLTKLLHMKSSVTTDKCTITICSLI